MSLPENLVTYRELAEANDPCAGCFYCEDRPALWATICRWMVVNGFDRMKYTPVPDLLLLGFRIMRDKGKAGPWRYPILGGSIEDAEARLFTHRARPFIEERFDAKD